MMSEGGNLQVLFDADAWDSTISFQSGIPVTLGGNLELSFATDVDLASQVGRTFDLFDWTGVNPTGQFEVASPYTWDLSNLYTTGEVTLTAVAVLAGDFNQNGAVDAADYVVRRDGLGTIYTQEHYNIWRANFGATLVAGNGAADPLPTSVPEPTGVALVCLGLVTLTMARVTRRRVFLAAVIAVCSKHLRSRRHLPRGQRPVDSRHRGHHARPGGGA